MFLTWEWSLVLETDNLPFYALKEGSKLTIKKGERAVTGLLLARNVDFPTPKTLIFWQQVCWGPLLARPDTKYYCLGAKT